MNTAQQGRTRGWMDRKALSAIVAGAIVCTLSGCGGGMRGIDSRTHRLLQERSTALGGGAIVPDRQLDDRVAITDRARATNIPTTNPAAADLAYAPADESRDLSARLERFSEAAAGAPGAAVLSLDLHEAWRVSQRSAREFLSAEEDYILAAVRLLIQRHLWSPRFFNDTTVSLAGRGDDGTFDSAARVINELRVTQRLPSGGDLAARWVWEASEQLRDRASGSYTQASRLALDADIPLLRGAGPVAREDLIQAERDLIYQARQFEDFRRQFLVAIASDYFELVQAQAEIANQRAQLESLRLTERAETARYEAGRIALFRRNIATNDVLQAQARLASLRESYILRLDRFKIRLGLSTDASVALAPIRFDLPDPSITLDEATRRALEYRLDLQTRRDRLDDSRRAVANARNDALPDLNVSAGVSVPTDPDERVGGLGFSPGDLDYSASVTFGLPLDREVERLRIRQAVVALRRSEREYDQFRDQVVVGVRQAVRQVELSRFQYRLAEERVKINELRKRELELKQEEADTQTKLDAENAWLESLNARDRAKTDLRNAILDYLLQSGQLRVARDGTFQPLPGMIPEPVPPEDAPPP